MDICRIVSYLKTHLWDDDEPTISRIAQEHGYSAFHLSREFKNQAGYSIRECIEALRIQRGIEQIMDHGMSVGQRPRRGLQQPWYLLQHVQKTHRCDGT